MKKLLILSIGILCLVACQDIEKTPKPKDLIPEPKMVEVLTEISLLHGARTYNKNILQQKGVDPKSYLWEKYDIDSLQFLKSNNYYAENYEQYQRIYDSVRSRLERFKVVYDTLRVREERRQDSIRKAEENDTSSPRPVKRIIRDSILPPELQGRELPPPASRREN